jgi:IS5 family transposase
MVDATIVPVPKQRNSREENEAVKAGKTPKEWQKNPAKNRQKEDARWTKKHGKSFYGYKNHVNADAKHKLIRHYEVTDASVHDSRKFYGLLNKANTSADVYADSAYRSAATEAKLKVRGLRSRIHQRASRNHTLSKAQENANHQKRSYGVWIATEAASETGRVMQTGSDLGYRATTGDLPWNLDPNILTHKSPCEQGSGSRRARVRCSANIAGWSDCTDDRYRAGESQDRPAEPRLQHPPACDAGADGRGITEKSG